MLRNIVLLFGLIISASYMNDASEAKNRNITKGIKQLSLHHKCAGYKEVLDDIKMDYQSRRIIKQKYKTCLRGE